MGVDCSVRLFRFSFSLNRHYILSIMYIKQKIKGDIRFLDGDIYGESGNVLTFEKRLPPFTRSATAALFLYHCVFLIAELNYSLNGI